MSDFGDAEAVGKAKFIKENKKRKNLGSADNGYNVSMSKLPQTKFKIQKAEPLYLRKKSLNSVDTNLKAIEEKYMEAINKVVKTIVRDVQDLKAKNSDQLSTEKFNLLQKSVLKYSLARIPIEQLPPTKQELILIAKEMGVTMRLMEAADAIRFAQKQTDDAN